MVARELGYGPSFLGSQVRFGHQKPRPRQRAGRTLCNVAPLSEIADEQVFGVRERHPRDAGRRSLHTVLNLASADGGGSGETNNPALQAFSSPTGPALARLAGVEPCHKSKESESFPPPVAPLRESGAGTPASTSWRWPACPPPASAEFRYRDERRVRRLEA